MTSFRTLTAVLATTALVGGTAAPAALAQTADYPTDSSTTQSQRPAKSGKKKQRRLSDAQLTRVATALGTTLDALKAAQADVKEATAATEVKETRAQRDAMLAAQLNVTVEQLRAAFASVRGTTDGTCRPGSGAGGGATAGTYPGESAAA